MARLPRAVLLAIVTVALFSAAAVKEYRYSILRAGREGDLARRNTNSR
jgi:hypothetical protein